MTLSSAVTVLLEGNDDNIATKSPNSLDEDALDTPITFTPVALGTTTLNSKVGETICAKLRLYVAKKVTIDVAVHFISDNANHGTTRSDALNAHYPIQSNFHFNLYDSDSVQIAQNLGPSVHWDDDDRSEWDAVINAAKNSSADINIYCVWDYTQNESDPKGGSIMPDCFVDDTGDLHTFCHEVGHGLGILYESPLGLALMNQSFSNYKILKKDIDIWHANWPL